MSDIDLNNLLSGFHMSEKALKESSWSRIVSYITNGNRFGVVSAFRGTSKYNGWQLDPEYADASLDEIYALDMQAHNELKNELKRMKIGYVEQKSVYDERDEYSFFLPLVLPEVTKNLGIKYKQQSVIVKSYNPNEFCLYYTLNFTDDDGVHNIGDKGMSFNQERNVNGAGKEILTFNPEVLKYANSMILRGSQHQKKQPFAFVAESTKWYEHVVLKRWSGLKAYKEGRPTEYWREIEI